VDRPGGPPTRSFIARALGAFLELDSNREALARARSQTAALEQQLATNQAELVAQQAELVANQAELAATGKALQSLRASRLVRWSGPLRRLWYRVPLRLRRSR